MVSDQVKFEDITNVDQIVYLRGYYDVNEEEQGKFKKVVGYVEFFYKTLVN